METDSFFLASLGQLIKDIPSKRCSINNIVCTFFCSPHRKSVMMARGESNVLGTRILECTYPLLCMEMYRIETRGHLLIFLLFQFSTVKIPFSLGKLAVYSPMQENTETKTLELPACFQVISRRNILAKYRQRQHATCCNQT